MTKYLLDTNIILRFRDSSDEQHRIAIDAVSYLLTQEHDCLLPPQVLIGFWAVATRPSENNGLGWTVEQTRTVVDELVDRFPLLEDSPQIFPHWLDLVTTNKVKGKRTHDARIVATMFIHKITHLLTFNPNDFTSISKVTVVRPQDLAPPDTDDGLPVMLL